MAIRERFAGKPEASVATFSLGRMAFDVAHDYLGAAYWFRAYLRERPGGSLARDAEGRLIEALRRGGDNNAAKEAARRYLVDYPNGPHAALARNVTSK